MHDTIRPLTAEALGTFLFVFIGCSAVVIDLTTGAFGLLGMSIAFGFAYAVGVAMTLRISGGYLNPAVLVALAVMRRIEIKTAVGFLVAQIAGAVVAAVAVRFLMPAAWGEVAVYGAPAIAPNITFANALGIEAVLTLVLVSVLFGTDTGSPESPLSCVFLGLAVTALTLAGGALTGAAMNPVRAFGPQLVSGSWAGWLVFWGGPILGAVVAAGIWRLALSQRTSTAAA